MRVRGVCVIPLQYNIRESNPVRHPDYDPDWAQKLISLSMSRHLSTRNSSSKSMHTFLSNLANRQTDKQIRAKTFTSSFIGGNNWLVHVADVALVIRHDRVDVYCNHVNYEYLLPLIAHWRRLHIHCLPEVQVRILIFCCSRLCLSVHPSHVSGWPLVWKTWKCQGIWQLSGKCRGLY